MTCFQNCKSPTRLHENKRTCLSSPDKLAGLIFPKSLALVALTWTVIGFSFVSPGIAAEQTAASAQHTANKLFGDIDGLRAIPIITNRNRRPGASVSRRFGGGRGDILHGRCSVSRTRIPGLQPLADTVSFHVPQSIDILEQVEEIETDTFWSALTTSADGKRPTLYVHGYRVDFAKACRRAARLQDNLSLAGRLAVFSWPSDGSALGYAKDEANVIWSARHLRQTLNRMVQQFGPGGFNLVAHSLGARGAIEAILQIEATAGETPVINRLILIAPDMDAGIFAQKAERVKALATRVSLYVSTNDAPLLLSREVHGYPRLGQSGPHLDVLSGIETIDVSDLDLSTPTGHVYHLYNGPVIDSLRKRLGSN